MNADQQSHAGDFNPWQFPENPFDYVGLVEGTEGMGRIPKEKQGTRIAVIGAGCSGLCAAYELMKVGLHPIVYESANNPDGTTRIGGRAYTYRFPGDPQALAELGAMRIPAIFKATTYYMDQFGIDYSKPFPDPLLVPTVLYFNGEKHFIPVGGPLPAGIDSAAKAWENLVAPLIEPMAQAWYNPESRSDLWEKYVEKYADRSFYDVLRAGGLSKKEIRLFGSLGIGTGGFDSLYPISFIEILRIVLCRWETDQRLIKGGVDQIPMGFWNNTRDSVYWGKTTVRQLNQNKPLPAVKEIFTPARPGDQVTITDVNGDVKKYDAVLISCSPRSLETDIIVNRSMLSDQQWTAIHNLHILNSGKVFVRTKKAFWKDRAPESTLQCTITDEPTRGTYLFDFDKTESGVICLSYTWEDSSAKFNALSHEDRVQSCLRTLGKIYGEDFISRQVEESISFYWEEAKGYSGAFKLNYPGQYDLQQALFLQPFSPEPAKHNGIFLAGDAVSWAGGWLEGAFQAGLNAAMAIIRRLGGTVNATTLPNMIRISS